MYTSLPAMAIPPTPAWLEALGADTARPFFPVSDVDTGIDIDTPLVPTIAVPIGADWAVPFPPK